MKIIFLALLLMFSYSTKVHSQTVSNNVQLGVGVNYLTGIDIDRQFPYKINSSLVTSCASISVFTIIPLSAKLNLSPTVDIACMKGTVSVINVLGDFIPSGYSIKESYSVDAPRYIDGDNYNYFLSDGSISQSDAGVLATYNFYKGLEVGSGVFYNFKTLVVRNYKAYDEYKRVEPTNGQTDIYNYIGTHVSTEYETDFIKRSFISLPVVIQKTWEIAYMSLILRGGIHLSSDVFYSVGFSVSFDIKKSSSQKES